MQARVLKLKQDEENGPDGGRTGSNAKVEVSNELALAQLADDGWGPEHVVEER